MSIHVALHHRTSYRYDRPISLGPQSVRLRPAPHCRTRVLSYSLKVRPAKHFINWQQDPQSNYIARLVFPDQTTELEIEVDLVAEMSAINPFDFFVEPYAEKWPFDYDAGLKEELQPYLRLNEETPLLRELVASVSREPRAVVDVLVELNQRLNGQIKYVVRLEPGLQTPEETLEKRSGSCRDSGWLLVQIMRRLGFAARFASGYLIQLVADTKPLEGPEGPTADFCDLHAWCEVYIPGAGWIGLDPTSGLLAGEGHLPLACSAEPSLAAPVSGLLDPCETTFSHEMSVTRVHEDPRVTKPYTDEEWTKIEALGDEVDAQLDEGDVRLTMGGEPTFVSADDLEGAEWNTAALGPTKKKLAGELFHRLRDEYGPAGLVHFGQGKWYPGEPLPRWSLDLFWRTDGTALWSDRALIADETNPDPERATAANAEKLARSIATYLGVDPEHVFPAYEDAYYYLWRERKLPINVEATAPKLADPLERERIRRLFTDGLDKPIGSVLPIGKDLLEASAAKAAKAKGEATPSVKWRSSPWHFRGDHCYLVPGDSPLGLRLPLDSTPWVDPKDVPPPGLAREGVVVKTALCIEPRGGALRVFMPPVDSLDDWIELVGAVERAAKEHALPLLFEGYTPPRDARLGRLSVTPDPGVIEVNIHPSSNWKDIVYRTTHLYEAARQTRLAAEKFMIDGRHAGTGGGNHVVLGGATPDDSPFLRRPDLLRSMIGYFHQHPALSFLFSGLFIGPTSQSPRVDEARNDSIFELEIAFAELDRRTKAGEDAPPWLVDRLFRDLLVDLTGNTHRAEFCIDKLYSPDGSTGRLGLLELRALEMPPHARMSLVQQLLLRALLAKFWKTPFAPARLTRWGTELHDRFMLPFWVWQDFEDVIADLKADGFAFETRWFAPHFEFRFPKIGDFDARGITVELRAALEPWHVMGEDSTAGGTARYVDSSLERVETLVRGWNAERFILTCNGVEVPLQPIGVEGVRVAGIRFRAWQPPRCLHPHIGVHTPLVFDLIDKWNGRSLGGCEYHVSHPGGRSHETRPINALEAEGRRQARFFRTGHTGAKKGEKTELIQPPPNPDFPFTLDLRRSTARTAR
ncbi:MAG: transglutaminase family protein [Labilithrix sp.]